MSLNNYGYKNYYKILIQVNFLFQNINQYENHRVLGWEFERKQIEPQAETP